MKYSTNIIVISLLITININSLAQQNLIINFTSDYYDTPIVLDSILIRNIGRQCDTMLYSPDTSLVLLYYMGVDENKLNESLFSISQNYPNPALNGKTSFDLFINKKDQLTIKMFDLNANLVADYTNTFSQGLHTFNIFIANRGIYLLKAIIGDQCQSIKIVCMGNQAIKASSIRYGSINGNPYQNQKTRNIDQGFSFELGDTFVVCWLC